MMKLSQVMQVIHNIVRYIIYLKCEFRLNTNYKPLSEKEKTYELHITKKNRLICIEPNLSVFREVLGAPLQPPVRWVTGLFLRRERGVKQPVRGEESPAYT